MNPPDTTNAPATTLPPPSTPPTAASALRSTDTPPASAQSTPIAQGYKAVSSIEEVLGVDVGMESIGSTGSMAGGGGGGAGGAGTEVGGAGTEGYVPAWMAKRAVEEAEAAKEKLVDGGFGIQWAGDDYDERDMMQ